MRNNDGLGCFIWGVGILLGVLMIIAMFMGFNQQQNCVDRGGETTYSGDCVKKGTRL